MGVLSLILTLLLVLLPLWLVLNEFGGGFINRQFRLDDAVESEMLTL